MVWATGWIHGDGPVIRPRGVRGRVVWAFGIGALLVTTAFAVLTYVLAHNYLVGQRERSAVRQAYVDASAIRDRLATAGIEVDSVLDRMASPKETAVVLHHHGSWYSSSALAYGGDDVPVAIKTAVAENTVVSQRVRVDGEARLVVGVPVPAAGAEVYEIVSLAQLDDTLRALSTVLFVGACLATIGGSALGVWASRSVLQPLEGVASTAAQIASGQLDTRLPATRDPDLATIVGSFNSMVDTLQQRIERDARLAADVSHELRSPLTTLIAAVEVLEGRRHELRPRSQRALDLITEELDRFRRLLDNLLELARADAGSVVESAETLSVGELLTHVVTGSGRSKDLLGELADAHVRGDKLRLERVLVNLLDNADQHGDGVVEVSAIVTGGRVQIRVDDNGSGVAPEDRDRIFERFATGGSARRSSSGTGLGLALVAETVTAHGGAVWCTDRPGGGCRFVVSLPKVEP
ncbi:MAG TPA: HAMP domain-containing sensor histidine kinase [Actinopolymorphaceae bacterium]